MDSQLTKARKPEKAKIAAQLERVAALEKELPTLQRSLYAVFDILQGSDFAPTTQALRAASETEELVGEWVKRWEEVKGGS